MEAQITLPQLLQRECFRKLYDGVHYAYAMAVHGDIAEFGTGWGRSAFVLSSGMAQYSRLYVSHQTSHGIGERRLYLFDSFEGLPAVDNEIDLRSPHVASGFWKPAACKAMSQDQLRTMCEQQLAPHRVEIAPGWFKETLPRIASETQFALVHIDCDLYESARDVLFYLFEHGHFADGCALFFDDWNCNRARPDMGERRAWREAVVKFSPQFDDCGEYDIGGHKFILHV